MSGWVLPEDIERLIFREYLLEDSVDENVTLGKIKTASAFSATCRDFYKIAQEGFQKSIPSILRAFNPTVEIRPLSVKYSLRDLTQACSPYGSGLNYWTRKRPQLPLCIGIEESKVYTWSPRVVSLCENQTALNLVDSLEDCIGVFCERREGRTALTDHCIDQMPNRFFYSIGKERDVDKIRKAKNYLVTTLLLCDDEQDMCSIRLKLKRKGLNFKDMSVMRFIFGVMKEYSIDQVISIFVRHVIGKEVRRTKGKPLAEKTIRVAIDSRYMPLIAGFMARQREVHRRREALFSHAMQTGDVEVCMALLRSPYQLSKADLRSRREWERNVGEHLSFSLTSLLLEKGIICERVALFEAMHSKHKDSEIKQYLESLEDVGVSFNLYDDKARSPLHIAVMRQLPACAQFLINSGLEVEERDNFGKRASDYCNKPMRQALGISGKGSMFSLCINIGRLGVI